MIFFLLCFNRLFVCQYHIWLNSFNKLLSIFLIYISRVVNNLPKFLSSNRLFVRPFKSFGEEHHSQITNQQWHCKLNSPNYTRTLEYSCLNFYLYILFLVLKLTIFNWLVLICKESISCQQRFFSWAMLKCHDPQSLKNLTQKLLTLS